MHFSGCGGAFDPAVITCERIAQILKTNGIKAKIREGSVWFTRPAGKRHNSYRVVPFLTKGVWALQRDKGKFLTHRKDSYVPFWVVVGNVIQTEDELLSTVSKRVYGGTPPWKN